MRTVNCAYELDGQAHLERELHPDQHDQVAAGMKMCCALCVSKSSLAGCTLPCISAGGIKLHLCHVRRCACEIPVHGGVTEVIQKDSWCTLACFSQWCTPRRFILAEESPFFEAKFRSAEFAQSDGSVDLSELDGHILQVG